MFLRFFLFSSLLNGVVDASINTGAGVDSIEAVAPAAVRGGSSSVDEAPSLVVSLQEDCEPIFNSILDSLAGEERSALRTASRRFLAPTRSVFLEELSDECQLVKVSAVRALSRIGKGDKWVIAVFLGWLRSELWDVRAAALRALPQVVEKGDKGAIAAISGRLTDADWYVCAAALEALSQVAEKGQGDEGVIAAISLFE